MKKRILTLMLLTICGFTFAQFQPKPQWTRVLSDQPETFRTQLISSTESSIKVNVQVPGFYTTNVTTPRGEAKIISMPKAVSTAKAGEPNVPMTGIPAIIGDQARMGIRVVDAQYMDFEGIEVAPSKGDFPRTIDPATVPYTYSECYSQDAFFPANNVSLYDPYIVRDFRGQNMVVYPYAYNPVTKTLRVYYNMIVEMYKVDNNGANAMETRRSNTIKMDPDFKSMYQRHFINYEASMNRYTPVDEEGDLLIICYDNFMSSMTDFVNWKKTRGVNTTIMGTSTAGSTSSALKTYIQNQYNANNNLTHVLLVGDVAQIPGYSYSGGGSGYSGLGDNPYGQIVGNDVYNDVFIGRFSASNTTHVATQVQKILTYERDLTTSDTWCQNGLGVSTTAGNGGHYNEDDYQHIENLRTDLLNFGYSTVYQDYYNVNGYPSSSTTTISNHINSGVGVINYCNHGSQTAWQSHYYSNSHVNALTNNNKLPFIFSVACLNGQYDYSSDCFAEAWMRATNNSTGAPTGAVGTLMSYISQPWIPPMWAQDEFVDILVESYSNNIKHTWGGAAINGLFAIFDNYSTSTSSAVGTYQAWILYGDPTLMLRTKTPQAMTVTHAGNIGPGVTSYTVSVSNGNGALATITDANHNILGRATVSNGVANITLSGNTTPGTELTLCVFGYNKVTYLGTINVVGGTQYTITATANPTDAGTVTGAGLLYENTTCTLTAVANSGWDFVNWNDGSTENPRSFIVTGPASFTANFTTVPERTITLASVMHGTINCDHTTAYKNDIITLTATPASDYNLESWVVFKTGDVNTIVAVSNNQFIMPNYDVTVSAIFSKPMGGDVTIGSGTTSGNYLPTGDYYKYSLSQQIYTASELGAAGTITAISFYYNTSTSSNPRSLQVYMSHTSSSTITSWSTVSSNQQVFSGTHTFTQGWNTIMLTTPFVYNGTSNLLLTVDDNTGVWTNNSQFYTYSTGANRAIYYRDDNTNPNPTGNVSVTANSLQVNAQMKVTKEVPDPEGYLSVSPTSLSGFQTDAGISPSEPQSIAIIGYNLQADLTITAPTGYEVCTTSNGIYNNTLTLTPSDGEIRQMVFVRLQAGLTEGNYNGTMNIASDTTITSVSLSGVVATGTGTQYTITVSANPLEGGMVNGTGLYYENTECTLTATANDGYTFTNWTKNDTLVSTNTTYTFIVTEDADYIANFSLNQNEITQVSTFAQGYNWWSTYIEQEDIDGLGILQEGLGDNGVSIRSQASGYTDYYENYGWYGSLTSINNESSYRVITSAPCTVTITGSIAEPLEHPITVSQGWTWIGYVLSTAMDVNAAMEGMDASQGDKLKSQQGYADFYSSYGWFGSLSTIEPGMGLMYYSLNDNPVTFIYPDSNRGGAQKKNLTTENNHWVPNVYTYPDNMTVMAVVEFDDEELTSDNYELAAFADNGECRGSVKLTYAKPLHRHVAFLTISGKDAAELSFRLYNAETDEEYYDAEESLDFVANAIVGNATDLYVIHFRGTTGMDELASKVKVYPNPVDAGEQFCIGLTGEMTSFVQVEIINALGVVVETVHAPSVQTLTAPNSAGVYTLRVTMERQETIVCKLVVK